MKFHYLKIFIIFIIFIDVVLLNAQEPKEQKKNRKIHRKMDKNRRRSKISIRNLRYRQ